MDDRNEFQKRIGVGEPSNVFRLKGGPGKVKRRKVIREDNGRVGGWHTEHWNDRVDATVTPQTTDHRGAVNK